MRLLSLDYGTKRIGVAISDELLIVAQGIDSIYRKDLKTDLEAINKLVKEYDVSQIVCGLPINMDGTYSQKTNEAIAFMDDLAKVVSVPITKWDERLTSMQADRILLEADMSRAKRRHLSDKVAAQLILQNYLDSRKKG